MKQWGFEFLGVEAGRAQVRLAGGFDENRWTMVRHLFRGALDLVEKGDRRDLDDQEPTSLSDEHQMKDLADGILSRALRAYASDIHLEPKVDALAVRYRIDGMLVPQAEIGHDKKEHLTAHLKIRAGMDVAEKRKPQDGRIAFQGEDRDVDLRVSTITTKHGEKMVLRVLDKSGVSLDLAHLGLSDPDSRQLKKAVHAPYGMVLVTGPTGSGKTTTLYSCLNDLNNDHINIVTIEDPIEYELAGINQMQVKSEIGVTFVSALRAFLRQDPNVIMVGEIRDEETASLAVRAAQTGHLVLSTLHTNDAVGAVPRMMEMGVPGHLLANCLNLVLAQRLLRKLCKSCRKPVSADTLIWPEGPQWQPLPEQVDTYLAVGCKECMGTGFKGRVGIFEILPVTAALRAGIAAGKDHGSLVRIAEEEGLKTLSKQALELICRGETALEEVLREVVR